MLVRLDEGGLIAVGGGERGEAASEAQRPRTQHTITIEEPPTPPTPGQADLPLT
jgi:hypothetical protein